MSDPPRQEALRRLGREFVVPDAYECTGYDFRFTVSRYPDSYLHSPVWCLDGTLIHFVDEDDPPTEAVAGTLRAIWLTDLRNKLDLLERTDMISQDVHDLAGESPVEDDTHIGSLSYRGDALVHQWMGISSMIIEPEHRGQRLGLLFMEHLLSLYSQSETLIVGTASPVQGKASKHTAASLAHYWKTVGFKHDPKTHLIHHHTNFVRRAA